MSIAAGEVQDGRVVTCPTCRARETRCASCNARVRFGRPNHNGRWDTVHLAEGDWRRLLMAAAEFDQLSNEHGEDSHAVEFMDWIFPDVVEG